MIEVGPRGELYTNKWYKEILSLNPRQTWRKIKERPWEHLLTGLSSDEIKPFLSFLGNDFRIPKKEEWLKLHNSFSELKGQKEWIKKEIKDKVPLPVMFWIENEFFPFTEEGILEMIEDNGRIRFIGKPFQKFYPNLWDPRTVRDINWDISRRYIGLRAVKDG